MNDWIWRGRAWVFGDDVPNDEGVMPLAMTRKQEYDPAVLARQCFSQLDPAFASTVRPGDVVFAGRNFACGNPHIQGFLGLKGTGVGVVAVSMSRGPLRACVNAGVPVLAGVDGAATLARPGDRVEVDFERGRIVNLSLGTTVDVPPLPDVMRQVVAAGGGIGFMKLRLGIAT